jgi:hypothetical protein
MCHSFLMSHCFECNVSMKYDMQNLEFIKFVLFESKPDFRMLYVSVVKKQNNLL